MSCKPGTPCYSYGQDFIYPRNCGIDPCFVFKTGTDLVFYNGTNLPCTGINTCDNTTLALEKIDAAICNLQNQIQNCCSTTTTTTTSLLPCICYEIANNGAPGSVTFLVTYADCNGGKQSAWVGPGSYIDVCAIQGTVVAASPAAVITNLGDCSNCFTTTTTTSTSTSTTTTTTTTGIPCHCYTVTNGNTPGGPSYPVYYTDCAGNSVSVYIAPGQSISFCAQLGSVMSLAIIVDNGVCTGTCP